MKRGRVPVEFAMGFKVSYRHTKLILQLQVPANEQLLPVPLGNSDPADRVRVEPLSFPSSPISLRVIFEVLRDAVRSRAALHMEVLALCRWVSGAWRLAGPFRSTPG